MILYKHTNNTDVAIEILKWFYIKETDSISMRVMWWNIGNSHAPWCMQLTQRIKMTSKQFKEWKVYKDYTPTTGIKEN